MKHIFYLHSNIQIICCFQTIKDLIENDENVIIILNRGCSWHFFNESVIVYDFAKIFQGEDRARVALNSFSAIKDYIRYRKYLCHLKRVVNSIIANECYYFYLPSMAISMTLAFARNKYCNGYYYVDEGSIAYLSNDSLKSFVPRRGIKNYVKSMLSIEEHYHYETTSKFKGTISISQDAFAWNLSKLKIVNPVNDFISEVKNDIPMFNDVILTEHLKQNYDEIINCIDYTVKRILQDNPKSKIGIKIHPHAITYNREKTINVQKYICEHYAGVVYLIPAEVSIEVMSLVFHPNLYSLFQVSSILLYALLFKSSESNLIVYDEGTVTLKNITTRDEFDELLRRFTLKTWKG